MNNDQRAAISRANGAKSRGPVTPEGKAVSARNSMTHGLTARTLAVCDAEDADLFNTWFAEFLAEHDPQTPTERTLVECMFANLWRRHRVWTLETAALGHEIARRREFDPHDDPAVDTMLALRSLVDKSRLMDCLDRYNGTSDTRFFRALSKLKWLQQQRPPAAEHWFDPYAQDEQPVEILDIPLALSPADSGNAAPPDTPADALSSPSCCEEKANKNETNLALD